MAIDPEAQQVLNLMAEQLARTPAPEQPLTDAQRVEATRKGMAAAVQMSGSKPSIDDVEDAQVDTGSGIVSVRIYRPKDVGSVLVWLHGGSFVAGDLDTHDIPLRAIALRARATVVAVDWRLAPEHPFPAGLDDAVAVVRWVAEGAAGAADPIYVGGDSAGGALAAALTLRCRDEGGPPLAGQVLIYPNTDLAGDGSEYPSWREHDGKVLTRADMEKNFTLYAGVADRGDPRISPIRADLRGLPRALVVTGEADPQRDEGEAYAHRLREAGVPVDHTRYRGMIHGFLQMAGAIDAGRTLIDQIGDWVARPGSAPRSRPAQSDDGRSREA